MRAPLTIAILAALAMPAAHAVEVDGVIGADEWAGARHITDFRLTQPLSREPAPQPTEAWVLATPEGLAIAFRNLQADRYPRTRQLTQRDAGGPLDRVNVYVDFDGEGRTGYNFTLTLGGGIIDTTVTSENQFNDDWDGDWRHAVTEDEAGWSAEILLPWHIATMREAQGDSRTIGMSLDRVIGATGERASWPAVSFQEPRFLSVFERIQIPAYSQSLLAVTPYVVGLYDNVGGDSEFDAGADLFWKPNGQFQLSATLNPDFGQVESDELVVNFGAVETFFSDRRPFFTENQGFFDVPFGSLNNNSRLLYTRRVGAEADDGSGASDVAAAVKLNGSGLGLNYGVFAASEDGDAGRDFFAARVTRDFDGHGLGAMATRVERPFLDREANVFEVDHQWRPSDRLSVRTAVAGSQVDQDGQRTEDSGAQVTVDHDLGNQWRQQLYALHLGDDLQLNDFGYLERNNFNYVRYELGKRITDLPETSAYASHFWRGAVSRRTNDNGVHIADAASLNRQGDSPWSIYGEARYAAEGLGGMDEGQVQLYVEPAYQVNDRLSFFGGTQLSHNPDWLLWRGGNLVGTYRSDQVFFSLGSTWLVDAKQELRVRLESIGLDAHARQAYRVADDGTPVAVDEAIPDFSLSNLAFQVRYRYELAPLSYLYIAYVRGGEFFDEDVDGFQRLEGRDAFGRLGDAFDLRDSEQLLVKLSYRFEI